MDILKRSYMLITSGSERVKSDCYLISPKSITP